MNNWSHPPGQETSRRRSQRVLLNVPITVSSDAPQGAFSEDTQTLVVNAHGALITLAAKVSPGQSLQIKVRSAPETQACRVVYLGPSVDGRTQLGIEFSKPAPNFWHITFPSGDWTTALSDDVVEVKKK